MNKHSALDEIQLRLLKIVGLLVLILIIGTGGFYFLSKDEPTLLECVYMTIISILAVGYEEIVIVKDNNPLMVFNIFLLLGGVGLITYSVSVIAAFVIEGSIGNAFGRKKMREKIQQMSNHTIVCGAGLTGTNAINELKKTGRDHVIIEMDSQRIETLKSSNENIFLQGDAGDEEVLMAAGIKRAAGLLACLPDDKDNLFMVLTARQLNSNLRIVSECVTPANNPKFFKAGADSVVSPQMIGGLRLVSELIRPSVVSFLDLMLRDQEKNMRIEEVTLSPSSELTGQTLESADLCRRFDLQVLATRSQNEENFVYNPDPKKTLDAGSTLVVLTKSEQFKKLQMLAEGK